MEKQKEIKDISTPLSPPFGLIHLRCLVSKTGAKFYWKPRFLFAVFLYFCLAAACVLSWLMLDSLIRHKPDIMAVCIPFLCFFLPVVLMNGRELFRRDCIDRNRKIVVTGGNVIPYQELAAVQVLRVEVSRRTRAGAGIMVYYELNLLRKNGDRFFICNCHGKEKKKLENEAEILRNLLALPCRHSACYQSAGRVIWNM